jgi:hypothetical protein
MAYDGAIAYIDRPGLQTASATIATVEARHAAYLRLLNGEVPFLEPFDESKAPDPEARWRTGLAKHYRPAGRATCPAKESFVE